MPTQPHRTLSQLTPLLTLIIAVGVLYFARVVFVPLVLAVLFAFLLTPPVSFLDRLRIPRVVSSVSVVVIAVVILGLLGWLATNQLLDVAGQLPAYRANIERKIDSIRGVRNKGIGGAAAAVSEIRKELIAPNATNSGNTPDGGISKANPLPVEIIPGAGSPFESLNTLVGPLTVFGIATIFTLFMLIGREDLRNRLFRLVGHRHLSAMTQAIDDAGGRVSRYLLLQLTVNVTYGVVIGIGLYLIGVPHALLWGAITALLRFLPYAGFWLSASLPVLLSVAVFDGWLRPVLVMAIYGVVEIVSANLIEPMLYGAHIGLSPLAILVSAVFWTILWGPIGLVISTPLTACLVVIGRYVPSLQPVSILLGDEEVLPPELQFYQRLLASDQYEAKCVLERYLENHSLADLYDLVVIPALGLVEQDRRHNELDEAAQRFIMLSTREIVEELSEKTTGNGAESGLSLACVPGQGEADEIVGCMLAQLGELAGHRCESQAVASVQETIAAVREFHPNVICVSSLPPFAVSHAGNLYRRLCASEPETRILIGLWNFPGDPSALAKRLRLREEDKIVMNLREAIAEIAPTTQTVEPETEPQSAKA